ncbi:MAG: right-handed parallel beta-helix repeat-containing protein [Methanosarcinales archaeon]|nr:right-handed parallel beta-helix repeat-containing protein [Methanosarcinales archaeon]
MHNICRKFALKTIAVITMLVILLQSGVVDAKTLTVDDSGEADYKKIQDAIYNARKEDTILVYSGTYNENIIVDKPLILKGIDNGGGKPVVKAVGPITLNAGDSTLDGFKTINGHNAGIYVNSNNNVIINNIALNNGAGGISFYEGSNNVIINNTALYNGADGISFNGGSNNAIDNNIVQNNRRGFSLVDSSNNTLRGNTIKFNRKYGIDLVGSSNNNIYNNFFNNHNNFLIIGNSINNWNITATPDTNIIGRSHTGGNVWTNPDGKGFSQTCIDENSDSVCDSSYKLENGNIDYLPLAYKPVISTVNLMNIAFIILTMTVFIAIYFKRDEMKSEIAGIIVNTSNDVIKGAIKGIFYGSIVSGLIFSMVGFTINPGSAVIGLTLGSILGVFIGAISGIIGGVSRSTIASPVFGAIGGAIYFHQLSGQLNDAFVISIIVVGGTFFGAIIGRITGETFFREKKDPIIGATIGGVIGCVIGGGELFEGITFGLIGSVIFGCIIGSLIGGFLGNLISTIVANKYVIYKNIFAGSISAAIVVLIAGIIVGPGESLIDSLIVSIISGAIFGWIIGVYFGTYKNSIFLAIFGGAMAGTIVGVVIGSSAIADAILIISSKIDFNVYFGGIVGAIVGWIVGKKPIVE